MSYSFPTLILQAVEFEYGFSVKTKPRAISGPKASPLIQALINEVFSTRIKNVPYIVKPANE